MNKIALLLVLAFSPFACSNNQVQTSYTGVFKVEAEKLDSQATAFLVRDDRGEIRLITAKHVCDDNTTLSLRSNKEIFKVRVVAFSSKADLCELDVTDLPIGLTSDAPRLSTAANSDGLAVGYGHGTFTTKAVENCNLLGRIPQLVDMFNQGGINYQTMIICIATVQGGMSGGPLLTLGGEIQGVVSVQLNKYAGFVSVEDIRNFLDRDLLESLTTLKDIRIAPDASKQ